MAGKNISSSENYKNQRDGNTKSRNLTTIKIAEVMDTTDLARLGRLKVHLVGSDTPKTDSSTWKSIIWTSPFAGATNPSTLRKGGDAETSYSGTQNSYGMWMVPPDVGNLVAVAFIDGNSNYGIFIGCLIQPGINHMMPGIAKGTTFGEEAPLLPVAEVNRIGAESQLSDIFDIKAHTEKGQPIDRVKRPAHGPHYQGLINQGLENDAIRGLTDSSARRESPSKVFGILTPGGHQFVMDDASQKQIRLRTLGGAQILLDDANNTVYVTNSNATGWVEITNQGKIEIFGADHISMRSEKDFNIRADRDINIESGRHINIKTNSTSDTITQPKSTTDLDDVLGTLHLDISGEFKLTAGKDISTSTVENTNIYSGKDLKLTQGVTSHISSGASHRETAGRIDMNSPGFPATATSTVSGISFQADSDGNLLYTNVLENRTGSSLNSPRQTETLRGSINTRFPTREPYPDHETKKLDNQS